MQSKIEFRNVTKSFGPKKVLTGASLAIPRGTTQVILGQSGSGKSVLIKCLLGLLPVDGGDILVDGQSVTKLKPKDRLALMWRFGMLFQSGALFDSLSVWENIAFVALQLEGVSPAKAKDLAVQKLAMVGLGENVAMQNPAELSGGMRKRVALARAIAHDPDMILYDEPTTGLDPVTSAIIADLMNKLQTELKCTSVVITHDMPCAYTVGDEMAFLHHGAFAVQGTVEDFQKSKDPMVRQFLDGKAQGPLQMVV